MRSKHLLAVALLSLFTPMSNVAIAAQTYSHWQKAARAAEQRVPYARAEAVPLVQYPTTWDSRLCTYQGGPKTSTWTCTLRR
jgi:hypothetical protein